MSDRFTLRDLTLFGLMLVAPFVAFELVVMSDSTVLDMVGDPRIKIIGGITASLIWLVIWVFAAIFDKLWGRRMEKAKGTEINDPTLAYASYLFDKEKE